MRMNRVMQNERSAPGMTYHDVGLDDGAVRTDRLHKEGLVAMLHRAVVVDVVAPLSGCVCSIEHLQQTPAVQLYTSVNKRTAITAYP